MKYLFIDTNIYKYLFNENSTFSDDVIEIISKLIESQKLTLILPRQVIDEVERNYLENWYIFDCDDKEKKKDAYVKSLDDKMLTLNEYPKIKKILEREKNLFIKKHKKTLKSLEEKYRNPKKSKAIKSFNGLKQNAKIIEVDDDILKRAILRDYKNNPPHDKSKITDAIIWESILGYFKKENKKSTLYFLADDACFGKKSFHPFLLNEIGGYKVKVEYRKGISSFKDLAGDDINKIIEQEKEEFKKNAINNFINSRSWASAGVNFTELLKYKNFLTLDDYKNIIKAASINDQIYGSFYVSMGELLEDEKSKGSTLPILEEIEDTLWKSLKEKNLILVNRKKDNISTISQD